MIIRLIDNGGGKVWDAHPSETGLVTQIIVTSVTISGYGPDG